MSLDFVEKFKSGSNSRKLEFLVAFFILITIVYFHATIFHYTGGLWRDESTSASLASRPLVTAIHDDLLYDSFPPGSTVIFHFWNLLSNTDTGFRVLGFLIGICILSAFWFNSRLLGLDIPLLSLSLFELNPIALRYGDAIRPYGLGIIFILITFSLVWKLATAEYSWKIFALAALAAVLSVQVMYQNAFLLLAICLAGVLVAFTHKDYKKIRAIIAVGGIAALSLVPYIGFLKRASEWSSIVKPEYAPDAIWPLVNGALGITGPIFILIFIQLLIGGALAFFILPSKKEISVKQKDLYVYSIVALVVSSVSYILFYQRIRVPSQTWYYIPLLAILAVCLDALFVAVVSNDSLRRNLKISIVLIALVLTAKNNFQLFKVRATNTDIIASRLSVLAGKDDLILINPWSVGVSFHRYYKGQAAWLTLPPLSDLSIHRYDLMKEKTTEENPIEPDLAAIQKTLSSGNQVWLAGNIPFSPHPSSKTSASQKNLIQGSYINPYIDEWTRELGEYMDTHAGKHEQLDLQINQEVNYFENIPLTVFEGWRQ